MWIFFKAVCVLEHLKCFLPEATCQQLLLFFAAANTFKMKAKFQLSLMFKFQIQL